MASKSRADDAKGLFSSLQAKQEVAKKNAKPENETNKAYKYFCDCYRLEYTLGYMPASMVGDKKMLKDMLAAYGWELLKQIITVYVKQYDKRFKSDKYRAPRIGGLKIYSNDIAVELTRGAKKEATVTGEDDIEWI